MDEGVGDASQEQRLHGGRAMRADHDQLSVGLGRYPEDRLPDTWVASLRARVDCEAKFACEFLAFLDDRLSAFERQPLKLGDRRSACTARRAEGGGGEKFKRRAPNVQNRGRHVPQRFVRDRDRVLGAWRAVVAEQDRHGRVYRLTGRSRGRLGESDRVTALLVLRINTDNDLFNISVSPLMCV
jgi:hypothetical protein